MKEIDCEWPTHMTIQVKNKTDENGEYIDTYGEIEFSYKDSSKNGIIRYTPNHRYSKWHVKHIRKQTKADQCFCMVNAISKMALLAGSYLVNKTYGNESI